MTRSGVKTHFGRSRVRQNTKISHVVHALASVATVLQLLLNILSIDISSLLLLEVPLTLRLVAGFDCRVRNGLGEKLVTHFVVVDIAA